MISVSELVPVVRGLCGILATENIKKIMPQSNE